MKVKWGIYDVEGKCWLGDETGPRVYVNRRINGHRVRGELLARGAATVINKQFNTTRRFRAGPYFGQATIIKDTITAKITGEEALRRILETP
jgi:hypothetical protein